MDRIPFVQFRAAALALAMLAGAPACRAGEVGIELHPSAEVAHTRVLLSDIATIRGDDARATARLAGLAVGEVGADGAATTVERQALMRWVHAHADARRLELAWSGAERCRIHLAAPGPAATERDAAPVAPAQAATTPLVVKGRYATLRSSTGGIRLESRVEVLQDGVLGQQVKVRLPNASDAIVARVSGPEEVEVTQ